MLKWKIVEFFARRLESYEVATSKSYVYASTLQRRGTI